MKNSANLQLQNLTIEEQVNTDGRTPVGVALIALEAMVAFTGSMNLDIISATDD